MIMKKNLQERNLLKCQVVMYAYMEEGKKVTGSEVVRDNLMEIVKRVASLYTTFPVVSEVIALYLCVIGTNAALGVIENREDSGFIFIPLYANDDSILENEYGMVLKQAGLCIGDFPARLRGEATYMLKEYTKQEVQV